MPSLADRIEMELGRRPASLSAIGAGASGSVARATFADGSTVVVKQARHDEADLTIEARGLRLLAERSDAPVPEVILARADLLVLEDMPGSTAGLASAETDAARVLARLHSVESAGGVYGLDHDGLIGPLPQENGPMASWVAFYRERRLMAMSVAAAREASLPTSLAHRIERLAGRLERLIPDRPAAGLIHGDLWSGNVLAEGGRVTALLDPAPYYADAEVELAFIGLFSTFGPSFFDHYHLIRGTPRAERAEFERVRRWVYALFPLLVHVRLFGSGYVGELDSVVKRCGE